MASAHLSGCLVIKNDSGAIPVKRIGGSVLGCQTWSDEGFTLLNASLL
jgi:hypothetical protein